MKKNSEKSQNEQAWEYAIGSVQLDGIRPSDEFLELAEKEKRGELTNEDIRKTLAKKYTVVRYSTLRELVRNNRPSSS